MPSPIAHVAAGYVVYRCATRGPSSMRLFRPGRAALGATVALSLLPDFDSALGLLLGDFGRYHNSESHSLLVGLVVALVGGCLSLLGGARSAGPWFALTLVCYELHILLDYFTWGRGVMAFWPVVPGRFSSPLTLFYGLHWSEGLVSARHLVTLLTEAPLAAAIVLAVRRVTRADARTGG